MNIIVTQRPGRIIKPIFTLLAILCYLTGQLLAEVKTLTIETPAPNNKTLEVAYHLPQKPDQQTRVMVLFGGRNWRGAKTLERYGMIPWADEMNIALVSPSFRDDDYWMPGAWSGEALERAIDRIRQQHGLGGHKLFYYGFSAGGQCAALFYRHRPERVAAWGAHGCGVYPDESDEPVAHRVPALVTCSEGDKERWMISRRFICRYREAGGELLWKSYPYGHELGKDALELARAFFTAVMKGEAALFVGDDDSGVTYPASEARRIHEEYRSVIYNQHILELWKRNDA